jgi:hypothetical protein
MYKQLNGLSYYINDWYNHFNGWYNYSNATSFSGDSKFSWLCSVWVGSVRWICAWEANSGIFVPLMNPFLSGQMLFRVMNPHLNSQAVRYQPFLSNIWSDCFIFLDESAFTAMTSAFLTMNPHCSR